MVLAHLFLGNERELRPKHKTRAYQEPAENYYSIIRTRRTDSKFWGTGWQ